MLAVLRLFGKPEKSACRVLLFSAHFRITQQHLDKHLTPSLAPTLSPLLVLVTDVLAKVIQVFGGCATILA